MYTAKEDNIATMKSSAQNFRNAATNAATDVAEDAKHDLRDAANKAGRKVRNLFNNASDEISHATETVTTQIRSNPVQSSMIALGVGVLLGALLRR